MPVGWNTVMEIEFLRPWATLMALGAKRIETRSRATNYRGWIAIHAAKNFPKPCRDLCFAEPFHHVLWNFGVRSVDELPLGRVLAVVNITDCLPTERLLRAIPGAYGTERSFGDYSEGRSGYVTEGVRLLRKPFIARGSVTIPWKLPRAIDESDLLP